MNMQNLFERWGEQSPEQWLASASQRLPFWLSILLVAAIGWYLARLVWLLYPLPDQVDWVPPPPPQTRAAAGPGSDYSALLSAHLFGEASAAAEPVVADVVDAPDTRLNLNLRATVAADDPQFAHAIIADGAGKENAYFLKDLVPGGATLHQVHVDRVILNRGGVLEALRLPRESTGDSPSARQPSAAAAAPAPAPAPSVQQVVQQNAANFTEIVRPQPFMPNGQLRGYRIYPGRNRQQFAALGLRPGDLVTEINGVALNNPAQGMEVFRSLGDSTQVTLTLERDGQSEVVSLNTSQFGDSAGTTQ